MRTSTAAHFRRALVVAVITGVAALAPLRVTEAQLPPEDERHDWSQISRPLPPLRLSARELAALMDTIARTVETLRPQDTLPLVGDPTHSVFMWVRREGNESGWLPRSGPTLDSAIAGLGDLRRIDYFFFRVSDDRMKLVDGLRLPRASGTGQLALGMHGNRVVAKGYDHGRNLRVLAAVESAARRYESRWGKRLGERVRAACLVLGVLMMPMAIANRARRRGWLVITASILLLAANLAFPFDRFFADLVIHGP